MTRKNIMDLHGTGAVTEMNKFQLDCIERVVEDLKTKCENYCSSHMLYRCTMHCEGTLAYLIFTCDDIDGVRKEVIFGVDLVTKEYISQKTKGLKFLYKKNGKTVDGVDEVAEAAYEMITKLVKAVPFSVGMLSFPIPGKFKSGGIMGYKEEQGTSLIAIEGTKDDALFNESYDEGDE